MFFTHFKYLKVLKQIYKQENLIENLSKLCEVDFKLDWWGRMYTVINPYIVNGKFDPSNIAYEYQEHGVDDNEYVKNQIMNKLLVAKQYIKTNNLFDMLTYEIKKIDGDGNFLLIIKSITHDSFVKTLKILSILFGVIGLMIIIWFLITYFNILNI